MKKKAGGKTAGAGRRTAANKGPGKADDAAAKAKKVTAKKTPAKSHDVLEPVAAPVKKAAAKKSTKKAAATSAQSAKEARDAEQMERESRIHRFMATPEGGEFFSGHAAEAAAKNLNARERAATEPQESVEPVAKKATVTKKKAAKKAAGEQRRRPQGGVVVEQPGLDDESLPEAPRPQAPPEVVEHKRYKSDTVQLSSLGNVEIRVPNEQAFGVIRKPAAGRELVSMTATVPIPEIAKDELKLTLRVPGVLWDRIHLFVRGNRSSAIVALADMALQQLLERGEHVTFVSTPSARKGSVVMRAKRDAAKEAGESGVGADGEAVVKKKTGLRD